MQHLNKSPKKNSHRTEKMAEQIKEVVANYLIHGARDSRIGFVTITRVRTTPDLQIARIYFTTYGDKKERDLSTKALQDSAKEIRHHVAHELNSRYTPVLEFFYDEELEEAYRMERIFYDLEKSGAKQ